MSRQILPGQPGDPWRSPQETKASLAPKNGSKLGGILQAFLKWLGIAISFAAVDWSNQREVYRILRTHEVPRAGILSEVISFRVRNHRRPWRIRLAFLAFLFAWVGIGALLWWRFGEGVGLIYMMIIGLYVFWIVISILGFILNRPDKEEKDPKR